jgi:hypothetical protein
MGETHFERDGGGGMDDFYTTDKCIQRANGV